MEKIKVTLFVSKESATYAFARKQVELACATAVAEGRVKLEIIDIAERPDLAEEHNIEALPTIIMGNRRFIGQPNTAALAVCLGDMTEQCDVNPSRK